MYTGRSVLWDMALVLLALFLTWWTTPESNTTCDY